MPHGHTPHLNNLASRSAAFSDYRLCSFPTLSIAGSRIGWIQAGGLVYTVYVMVPAQTQPASAVVGQQPLPISVSVITLNEEQNLARCLKSVAGLAAEIVVIDSGSADRTAETARSFGITFERHPWEGFGPQKNFAVQRCRQRWVLCLDADEALSPELAQSIRKLFAAGEPELAGYWVNRRTWYLGRWIWHAWYPEWRLRLVRKERSEWRGIEPHPELFVSGPTDRLAGDLFHYPFRDLSEHLQRWLKYGRIMAEVYAREGRPCHWYDLVFSPPWAFFKRLILKGGWRDGWRGWIISCASLIYVFSKYAFLLEKRLTQTEDKPAKASPETPTRT